MKKYIFGLVACGALIGTVAIAAADYGAKNRRKLLKCKHNVFRTVGSAIDTMLESKK